MAARSPHSNRRHIPTNALSVWGSAPHANKTYLHASTHDLTQPAARWRPPRLRRPPSSERVGAQRWNLQTPALYDAHLV
eukprot:5722571-Prymnesium_polylepis.1